MMKRNLRIPQERFLAVIPLSDDYPLWNFVAGDWYLVPCASLLLAKNVLSVRDRQILGSDWCTPRKGGERIFKHRFKQTQNTFPSKCLVLVKEHLDFIGEGARDQKKSHAKFENCDETPASEWCETQLPHNRTVQSLFAAIFWGPMWWKLIGWNDISIYTILRT